MQELDSFLDSSISLPVGGKTYRVAAPSAMVGLQLRRLMLTLDETFDEAAEAVWAQRLLGDTLTELRADGVGPTAIQHIGRYLLFYWGRNAETAEAHWNGENPDLEPVNVDPLAPGYLGPWDPGGGPVVGDPKDGVREWFNDFGNAPSPLNTGPTLTWDQILKHWRCIAVDLHTIYTVDVDSDVLHTRTWPWLETRILDLATRPGTRLSSALQNSK